MVCPICDGNNSVERKSIYDGVTLICSLCFKYERALKWDKVITKSKRVYETWPSWKNHVLKMKRKMEK